MWININYGIFFLGNDLFDFKYNLRQRTPVKIQNEQISVSNETEEVYSPVVSEYLPPPEDNGTFLLFIIKLLFNLQRSYVCM